MDQDANKLTLAERIGRVIIGIIAIFCVLFVLLGILGDYVRPVFLISSALFVGWVSFLERTFASIDWNWGALAIFVVGLLVIGVMSDYFLKWVSGCVAGKRGKSFIWPTRWTWCGLIATGLFFAVGMSVGGTLHQIGWMAGSDEPMVLEKRNAIPAMKQIDGALQQAILEEDANFEKVQQRLWRQETGYFRDPAFYKKQYNVFVMVDFNGKITSSIIFPRSKQQFEQVGGLADIDGEGGFFPAQKIRKEIETSRDKWRRLE